jgi:NADPH:quinone reductase-like Zn-dependent oxidoreductase
MHAIRAHQFGSPDVLVYETMPTPTPGPGEILTRVEAAAVNYADLMRRSATPYPFPTSLPYHPGSEVAGTVAALGEGVAGPALGTPVFALVGRDGSSGYAQYATASANQVIPIPPGLSSDQACAVVVAGLTALLILKQVGRVQPGETVFVPGAGGGVGLYAVQLAKLLGAGLVIGGASSDIKRSAAQAHGADIVIDYTQADWAAQVQAHTGGRGADVVLEMSGGAVFAESLRCLAPFGRMVVFGMAGREPLQFDPAAQMEFFYRPALNQSLLVFNLGLWFGLQPAIAVGALEELIGYVARGLLQVPISHRFPLAEAAAAHRLIEARQTTGKVILQPWV